MPCAPCALAGWPVSPRATPPPPPLSTANNLFPQVENLSHRTDCCSGSNELFQQNSAKTFIAQKSRKTVRLETIITLDNHAIETSEQKRLIPRSTPRESKETFWNITIVKVGEDCDWKTLRTLGEHSGSNLRLSGGLSGGGWLLSLNFDTPLSMSKFSHLYLVIPYIYENV